MAKSSKGRLRHLIKKYGETTGRKLYYANRHKKRKEQRKRDARDRAQRLEEETNKFILPFQSFDSAFEELRGLFCEKALILIILAFMSNMQLICDAFSVLTPFSAEQLEFVLSAERKLKQTHENALKMWRLSGFGKSMYAPQLPPYVTRFLNVAHWWLIQNKQLIYEQNKAALCEILERQGFSNLKFELSGYGSEILYANGRGIRQVAIHMDSWDTRCTISPDTPMVTSNFDKPRCLQLIDIWNSNIAGHFCFELPKFCT
jgi:hypothetical protein